MNGTTLGRAIEFSSVDRIRMNLAPEAYARDFVRDLAVYAAPKLEEGRLGYRDTGEDGLTHALLAYVYVAYPGASRETDANGHVDVSLKHPVLLHSILLGEAKVIEAGKSFDWYSQGMTKLVAKYNSGRNELALMICYCRFSDMYLKISEFQRLIERDKVADFQETCDLGPLGLDGTTGVFATKHLSAGRAIHVVHVWANMHSPTDVALLASKMAKQGSRKPSRGSKPAVVGRLEWIDRSRVMPTTSGGQAHPIGDRRGSLLVVRGGNAKELIEPTRADGDISQMRR